MQNETNQTELSHTENETVAENDTIFSDINPDMTGYDKHLKRARIWLYVIAGIQLIMGIYEYNKMEAYGISAQLYVLGFDAGIGLVFLALCLWSYKKPIYAFTSALIFYILVQLIFIISDPTNIIKGILLKVLITVALIRAIKDAKETEALKASFGHPQ